MITCPHCCFMLAGPDMPTKIEPGMICPVCYRDMSLAPIRPVTGGMVALKYVACIVAGPTSVIFATIILTPLTDALFGKGGPMVGLALPVGFLMMFVIGSWMDSLMAKTVTDQRKRWLLLASPLALSGVFWALLFSVM